ncbi:GeoRSP system radical SAM/SPASM protein [Geoalkalibacter halelectricus]|uniref:GeoRSP system radical SAM/SPASM protein n=1 Tax=Geoalkalibacter halelectricus TaxID=2847045 RepID=A0ABY5ZMS4_9BACT|nr:GeoRSP system radical SAM/SPASM protein [Geoalkalibacter halelectricus]MDO3379638.1 GeoRSP system radical SAM/SPASM protein [Geoalkalibacter halelectricus]UWZ78546.1 GeoRSP system radical SAM/SPASM protein [Geoalkalibacter halelectricus]
MSESLTDLFSAPLTFNWTLSFRCNFVCAHCYSRYEQGEELPLAELRRIVDVLAQKQVPFINFGGGEPLLRPDLYELAAYARDRGLNVSMNSNGWLLDRDAAHNLRAAGFSTVGISIDSHRAALHDDFRCRSGSFERALAALDHLRAVGIKTTMSSVISRINHQHFRDLLDLARAHGVSQVYLHNFKCSGKGFENRQELDLSPAEWRAFYLDALAVKNETHDLAISFDDPVIASLPQYPRENSLVKGSSCGKLSLHLRPNGDITPCGFIPVVVGNILRDDFDQIWFNSPVLNRMRNKTAKGKCGGCEAFEDCLGGCTARALAVGGDFDEPDPHCWK